MYQSLPLLLSVLTNEILTRAGENGGISLTRPPFYELHKIKIFVPIGSVLAIFLKKTYVIKYRKLEYIFDVHSAEGLYTENQK